MSIRRWAFVTLGDDQAVTFVAMARPGGRRGRLGAEPPR